MHGTPGVIAFEVLDQATGQLEREYAVALEMPAMEVITVGGQGPPGRNGNDATTVSAEPDNRLEAKPDGLYVKDDLTPDPLAYYILAKG